MTKDIILNLGCDKFKIPGFTNIDINPEVSPDMQLDLLDLDKAFDENSVDFIYAGHVLEHLPFEQSKQVLAKCQKILKPFRVMLIVVPDYSKCLDSVDITTAEKVIMANGDHKMLFNRDRLHSMIKSCGFKYAYEVNDLKEVPFLLVSNIYDPKPDPWQTAFLALKM